MDNMKSVVKDIKDNFKSGDETIEKLVWLREDNMQPVYAELFADGTRELSIRFTSYQENGG